MCLLAAVLKCAMKGPTEAQQAALNVQLDPARWGRPYPPAMGRDGLFVGELAKRSGVTRKALRIYEAGNILPPARRTRAGYRVYDPEVLGLVAFVKHAQGLGFRLEEIREIVAIRRSGRVPCPHVKSMVRQKLADVEVLRRGLRTLLRAWGSRPDPRAAVCPHIERTGSTNRKAVSKHGR
jgi:DNA-binding transcriptional MerR regulator